MNVENISRSLVSLNNDIINFKGNEISSIITTDKKLWIKGIDITKLLGYKNINHPLAENLKDRQKCTLENLINIGIYNTDTNLPESGRLVKNEKNTIYINESGLYRLLLKSRLPIAEEFQVWLEDDVLPKIRQYGSYSIQTYENEIVEDNNIFWDENSISDYDDKSVIYIAFIGLINSEKIYKFGKSEEVYTREFKQHKKTFEIFNMYHIEICNNISKIERKLNKILESKNLIRKTKVNDKNQTELFTVTPQFDINMVVNSLKELVVKYPLPAIKNLQDENDKIKINCELENKKIEIDYLKKKNEVLLTIKELYEEIKINYKEIKDEYILYKKTNINNKEQSELIKQYNTKNIESNNKIIEKNNIINELNNKIIEKDYMTNELNNNNIEKDKIIDGLNNKIIEKDILLIEKNNIIDKINKKIIEKDNIISKFNNINTDLIITENQNTNILNNSICDIDSSKHIDTIESIDNDICITTDDFFEKYIIEGEDMLEDKYRILSVELFEFYNKKCELPLGQYTFISYIKDKYKNVQSKKISYNYIFKQTWVGIKLINCKEKEVKLNILIKKFIEENCEIDNKLCIYTKDFHIKFKEYCESNNFIPSRFNGWSEHKCREALTKLGYGFKTEYKNKYSGLAMKNNRDLCTNEEMIYFFIKDRCIITNNNKDIISSLDLFTAFQKYHDDTKRKISTNKQKITEKILFEEIDESYLGITVKKYRSKYREAINIKLKSES